MKKSMFVALFLAISLGSLQPAYAGLKEGEAAYKRQDYVTALKELTPLAQQGDAKAQFYLGLMYAKGRGVAEDDKQAVAWFRKAAEQGHEQSIEALRVLDTSTVAGPFEGHWSYSQLCGWRLAVNLELKQKGSNVVGFWAEGHRSTGWIGELKGKVKNNKLFIRRCGDSERDNKDYICPNFEPYASEYLVVEGNKMIWYRDGNVYHTLHKRMKGRPNPQDDNCLQEQ